MRTVVGETISGRIDAGTFENLAFDRCVFDNCCISRPANPSQRPIVRSITLKNATQRACFVHATILEDISLHRLDRLGNLPLFFWGCVFRHVRLTGKISGIKINTLLEPVGAHDQQAWNENCREYYRSVDWALDIKDAEFQGSISFEAIPGSLIRRDEETQLLVTRAQLQGSDWQALDFGKSAFNICIRWFLDGSLFDDVVLVAAKRSKNLKDELAVLQMLRREGVGV